jgi:hypothetical protein
MTGTGHHTCHHTCRNFHLSIRKVRPAEQSKGGTRYGSHLLSSTAAERVPQTSRDTCEANASRLPQHLSPVSAGTQKAGPGPRGAGTQAAHSCTFLQTRTEKGNVRSTHRPRPGLVAQQLNPQHHPKPVPKKAAPSFTQSSPPRSKLGFRVVGINENQENLGKTVS